MGPRARFREGVANLPQPFMATVFFAIGCPHLDAEIFRGVTYGCGRLKAGQEGSGLVHWVRVDLAAPGIGLSFGYCGRLAVPALRGTEDAGRFVRGLAACGDALRGAGRAYSAGEMNHGAGRRSSFRRTSLDDVLVRAARFVCGAATVIYLLLTPDAEPSRS